MRDVIAFSKRGYDIRIYHLTHYNRREVVHDFAQQTVGWSRDFAYFASTDVIAACFRTLLKRPRALGRVLRDIVMGCWRDPVMLLKSLFILPKSLRISEDILEWGGDHVHAAYAGHPATCAWIVRRVADVPFSVSCHAHDIFETQALLRTKLPEADFVRTISEYNRNYILRHVPDLVPKPPVVIHVGAFLENLAPPAPFQSEKMQVLYVGSLEARKGIDVLLRAVAQANLGDWHLDIVGGGPERQRLEALSVELGLSDRVTFHGAQPNERVAQAMAHASVMVVPSRIGPRNQTEGLPTVIVEALAHQRPVIATRLTGIPEIIIHGVTGWLFEVDDTQGPVSSTRGGSERSGRGVAAGFTWKRACRERVRPGQKCRCASILDWFIHRREPTEMNMNALIRSGEKCVSGRHDAMPPRVTDVVLIIDDLGIGGAQRVLDVQLRAMRSGPYSIRVINLSGPTPASERIRALGLELIDIQQNGLFDLASWKVLWKAIS